MFQGSEFYHDRYNDLPLEFDQEIYTQLVNEGIDDILAMHYAHLFIRDPLVLFSELVTEDVENSSDHFENIQSTNWQTMRFKPPPFRSDIGWRVEFRSMDIQLTDHQNAALAIFVVLLTRTILKYNLNFYQPLAQVDINMQKAQRNGACLNETFQFRKDNEFPHLTLDEIFNGREGLIIWINKYTEESDL